jgi:hypothetical protein
VPEEKFGGRVEGKARHEILFEYTSFKNRVYVVPVAYLEIEGKSFCKSAFCCAESDIAVTMINFEIADAFTGEEGPSHGAMESGWSSLLRKLLILSNVLTSTSRLIFCMSPAHYGEDKTAYRRY